MDNVKNDLFYLEKLREDLKFIVAHTKDISFLLCFCPAFFFQEFSNGSCVIGFVKNHQQFFKFR